MTKILQNVAGGAKKTGTLRISVFLMPRHDCRCGVTSDLIAYKYPRSPQITPDCRLRWANRCLAVACLTGMTWWPTVGGAPRGAPRDLGACEREGRATRADGWRSCRGVQTWRSVTPDE
eukprot:3020738-Prymnesium_polylepis.1